MSVLRTLPLILLVASSGCARVSAPEPKLPLRILTTELTTLPAPTPEPSEPDATDSDAKGNSAPRIGAPGGSGAGSRRVAPAQSGNEAWGGLPAGIGGVAGPAGRG
jgi:hypothetical protein